MISAESLMRAGIARPQAEAFAEPLKAACALFDISTPERVAAFLAQCSHESAGFRRLEESLHYTSADWLRRVFGHRVTGREAGLLRNAEGLANVVYANRLGNGPEASGDGARFVGRGLIQLTGRTNYTRAAAGCGRPYVENPAWVAEPSDAALTAAWYWREAGCNAMADARRFDDITRAINGPAMLGAEERRALYERALPAFA